MSHFPKFSNRATHCKQLHIFVLCTWIVAAYSTEGLPERPLSRPGSTCPSPPSVLLIINSSYSVFLQFTFVCVWDALWHCHMCYKPCHKLCLGCLWSWNCSTHDSANNHQLSEWGHMSSDAYILLYFAKHYDRRKQ